MPKSLLAEFLIAGLTFTLDGDRLIMHGHQDWPDAERARVIERFKSLKDVKDEAIAEFNERNDTRRGYSYDSAHEFLQYCLAGYVGLHTKYGGRLDWSIYSQCDKGSLYFIFEIWCEASSLLCQWKDQGKLDEFLAPRCQNSMAQAATDPRSATEPSKEVAQRQAQLQFDCMAADSEHQV